eukprot:COSAG01_NODE_4791_length_4740_cov_9.356820_2_plen_172_part_00
MNVLFACYKQSDATALNAKSFRGVGYRAKQSSSRSDVHMTQGKEIHNAEQDSSAPTAGPLENGGPSLLTRPFQGASGRQPALSSGGGRPFAGATQRLEYVYTHVSAAPGGSRTGEAARAARDMREDSGMRGCHMPGASHGRGRRASAWPSQSGCPPRGGGWLLNDRQSHKS